VESLVANLGTHTIVLRVFDDNSVSDSDGTKEAWYEMSLQILYIPNTAPVCPASLPDLEIDNEADPYDYNLYSVSDAESADSHTYSYTSVPAIGFASINGSVMTFTLSLGVTGSYSISLTALDDNTNNGANGPLSCSVVLNLAITGRNYEPGFSTTL